MSVLDWFVIAGYSIISIGLGIVFSKKASKGIESFFASDRSLGWWLAGTSMAATAFSSDTPLLVTGIVRRKGIWGNWEIWALGISTMLAVFFFSRLWKRAGVLTEVELVELRYSGKPAAFLRGFKALYWGIFYNAFIMGAWPMTGLAKVMQETTGWGKAESIIFCMALTATYACMSGYWGVILTDFFQFILAMGGAFLLAFYAVDAAGGMANIVEKLSHTDKLLWIPPATSAAGTVDFINSPFGWFLGLIFFQWWAWKNTDGGGIIVQRIASCKNEKHAIYAVLWFNIAQYALRAWPWIITALASLIILPDLVDHERAYPQLITLLMPNGLRGLMVASFFAAFMSTMSTHLNWGSSYFVNDFYKRFVRKEAEDRHYVNIGRMVSVVLAVAATCIAFVTESIGAVFTLILNLTAVIGPVYLLRWFWWRVNPWSEITAMAVSVPLLWLRPHFFHALHIPEASLFQLLYMILAGALCWIPVTLLTPPVPDAVLLNFYEKVLPPGFWKKFGTVKANWTKDLVLWILATLALFATTAGPLLWVLQKPFLGITYCMVAVMFWVLTAVVLAARDKPARSSQPR
jgi:solute:Na+ symporter, SSS family